MKKRPFNRLQNFIKSESFSGILLFVCALSAIIVANSPLKDFYFHFLHIDFGLVIDQISIKLSISHWINEVLMSFFFLMVGLEIKRELLYGELASAKKAAFPTIAAIGGIIVPAAIFIIINYNTPYIKGFGIPMATDIAFALGVMLLLGKYVPSTLKVFLVALAVVDDLGAILVIAIFYASDISFVYLGFSALLVAVLIFMNYLNIKAISLYLLVGSILWVLVYNSGIHATIAAVVLALCIPAKTSKISKEEDLHSPLHTLEHRLQPFSAYLIMPLFALANAGVNLAGTSLSALPPMSFSIVLGIAVGLVIGKPIGIFLFTFIFEKLGVIARPNNIEYSQILGVGMLAGIGFTMSIFVANLAYEDEILISLAKLAILAASLLAGLLGAIYLAVLYKIKESKKRF